jgi:hypothetical protein
MRWTPGRGSLQGRIGDTLVTPAEVEYAFESLGDESALVVCVACSRSARSDH